MKLKVLYFMIAIFTEQYLQAQTFSKHSLRLSSGYAYGVPDKRYDFMYDKYNPFGPVQTVILYLDSTTIDDEYSVAIRYDYKLNNRVSLGLGLGYAQLVQDFLLPADGNGYFRQLIKPFFWRDESQYHMLQLVPNVDFLFCNNKSFTFGTTGSFVGNISFRKHINRFNLSRNNLEYFSSEMYGGLYTEYKRIRIDVGYRVLHWKYRDDAIENNGLRVDTYNLPKWRFQVSYKILGSKS